MIIHQINSQILQWPLLNIIIVVLMVYTIVSVVIDHGQCEIWPHLFADHFHRGQGMGFPL